MSNEYSKSLQWQVVYGAMLALQVHDYLNRGFAHVPRKTMAAFMEDAKDVADLEEGLSGGQESED